MFNSIVKKCLFLLTIVFTLIIFKNWFLSNIITATDFPVIFQSTFHDYSILPTIWHWDRNNGLGGNASSLLWDYFDFSVPIVILGNFLGFGWGLVEKIGFFYPTLVLSFVSSLFLFRKLFPSNSFFLFAPILYSMNSYALMVIGGGQILIALSYALAPVVLYSFIRLFQQDKNYGVHAIIAGTILAVQALFDIRIALILTIVALIYFVLYHSVYGRFLTIFIIKKLFIVLGIPILVVVCLHAFWLLPTVLIRENPISQLGSTYATESTVAYLSFAKFSYAFSLLHPNWPENIFGKVD